jgi:hypothetical protein
MISTSTDRRELHNVAFDSGLATRGLCGNLHLPTGRACVLPALHRDGCRLEPPDLVDRLVGYRAGAGPGSRRNSA